MSEKLTRVDKVMWCVFASAVVLAAVPFVCDAEIVQSVGNRIGIFFVSATLIFGLGA